MILSEVFSVVQTTRISLFNFLCLSLPILLSVMQSKCCVLKRKRADHRFIPIAKQGQIGPFAYLTQVVRFCSHLSIHDLEFPQNSIVKPEVRNTFILQGTSGLSSPVVCGENTGEHSKYFIALQSIIEIKIGCKSTHF